MKMQKTSATSNRGLQLLSHIAMASAHAGANSACAFIFHDPEKPEALKKLRKI